MPFPHAVIIGLIYCIGLLSVAERLERIAETRSQRHNPQPLVELVETNLALGYNPGFDKLNQRIQLEK
jgi:hypothetical protein